MDLASIQQYLDYTPYTGDVDVLMRSLLAEKANYLSSTQKDQVRQAYTYARKHHQEVKRLSGEAYIVHPVRVLDFLMEIQPDVASMQTALLHDVIEDTSVTYEDVQQEFGDEVAELCAGLVKVSKIRYKGEDRQLETLKKTFLAMGKDLRVIIIKIADRVHNIQTLHYHPKPEKRKRIANETLKVYVPIAKRLGLYVYQGYLENGSFRMVDSKSFERIVQYINKHYVDPDLYKQQGIDKLTELCREETSQGYAITGRFKSPHRIRKKLQKYQTNDIGKIMDILAFRVLTDTVADCYNMLGIIHKYYTPIFSKMKDYIALPKPNGYKSLHTTVLGMFDFPVEIQVRTHEMEQVANYGVAAHYAYSDAGSSVKVSEKQAYWIEKMQEIVEKYKTSTDKEHFKDELNIEILQKNIFVYTPKGDIVELPIGSTVLDFAFRVHTDIGLKFKNAFINGRIVPIDYQLKTGDIVDIHTFKNKYTATSSWLQYLHTPSAKSKLNRYIRQQHKDEIMDQVTQDINERLKAYDLPLLGAKDDLISKQRKGDDYEQLLLRIRDKQISIAKLIKDVYHDTLAQLEKEVHQSQKEKQTTKVKQRSRKVVIDRDKENLEVSYCPECNPQVGDMIIARSAKDGIKVHTLECDALQTLEYRKLLPAHRAYHKPTSYIFRLTLLATDVPGILLKILKVFEFLGINLKDIHTQQVDMQDKTTVIIDLQLKHPSKIYYIMKEVKQNKQLFSVTGSELVDSVYESS